MSVLRKPHLLKAAGIFLSVYLVSLVLWIQVKDSYGYAMTLTASKLAAGLKSARLEEISREKGTIQVTFTHFTRGADTLIDIPVNTSSYTFNAPLTFAIMGALFFVLKRRKRAYAEALAILVSVHFFYVFSLETKELTEVFMDRGLEAHSVPRLFVYQFLWGFIDNMVIRFEPFLIGIYMFLRFRKDSPQAGQS